MGWDAYAIKNGKWIYNIAKKEFYDLKHEILFTDAVKLVVQKTKSCDGYLRDGALDCTVCAEAIEEASGYIPYPNDPLNFHEVKELWDKCDWTKCTGKPWAIESAKEFLRVCAENNLGIRFSW